MSENSDGNISGHWPLVMVVSCFVALGSLYSYGIYRALHPGTLQVRSTELNTIPKAEEDSQSNRSSKSNN